MAPYLVALARSDAAGAEGRVGDAGVGQADGTGMRTLCGPA
jgi:hypothetical protein